jgi:antitoxin YefM
MDIYFCQLSQMQQAKEATRLRNADGISQRNCVFTAGHYPVHAMKSITYTEARENLANTINRVCEDNAPVIITRKRDQSVVMLSLSEYESLQETAHLLRSPANAKRLLDSLDSIKRGRLIRKRINLDE